MKISEVVNITYYHGSSNDLPVGTILKGRGQDYEQAWSNTDFYNVLEHYRPADMISHKDAVFMCDNIDDVDLAGGATDYIFVLEPLGKVEKHDLNWGSEISSLVSDQVDEVDPDIDYNKEIENAARNYWAGVPHHSEQVWEYLTTSAKIIGHEEY